MTDSETELPNPTFHDGGATTRRPPVLEMVRSAIGATEDRKGATIPGIKKWILANYPEVDQSRLKSSLRTSLKKGLGSGQFVRPKNSVDATSVMLGRYKLGKDPKKTKTTKKLAIKKKLKKKAQVASKGDEDDDDDDAEPTTQAKRSKQRKRSLSHSLSFSPKPRTSKSKQLRRSVSLNSLTSATVVLKKAKLKESPAKKSVKKSKAEVSPKKVPKSKKSEKTSKNEKQDKVAVKKDKKQKKGEKSTKSKSSEKNTAESKSTKKKATKT